MKVSRAAILFGAVAALSACSDDDQLVEQATASCGQDFYTVQTFESLSNLGSRLQLPMKDGWVSTPVVFKTGFDDQAGHHYQSADNGDCQAVARAFGSSRYDKIQWEGTSDYHISFDDQFIYRPVISVDFVPPSFTSLADWRSQGSPSLTPAEAQNGEVVVKLKFDESLTTLLIDEKIATKPLELTCEENFHHRYEVAGVTAEKYAELNAGYCENNTDPDKVERFPQQCLIAQMRPPALDFKCAFNSQEVLIPRSDGSYFAAEISGELVQNTTIGFELRLNSANILK